MTPSVCTTLSYRLLEQMNDMPVQAPVFFFGPLNDDRV